MSKKNNKFQGIVYSTNPEFEIENDDNLNAETRTPDKQNLLVRISTSGRGGKKASLVQRFVGKASDLEALGVELKKHLGTGGTVKGGEIVIQGDFCKKIVDYLISKGYRARLG